MKALRNVGAVHVNTLSDSCAAYYFARRFSQNLPEVTALRLQLKENREKVTDGRCAMDQQKWQTNRQGSIAKTPSFYPIFHNLFSGKSVFSKLALDSRGVFRSLLAVEHEPSLCWGA